MHILHEVVNLIKIIHHRTGLASLTHRNKRYNIALLDSFYVRFQQCPA